MILVDYSQVVIAAMYADMKDGGNIVVNEDILRHMILNTLRALNVKFRHRYGKMIIAADGKDYWRCDIFSNYKANRKTKREKSDIDWAQLYRVMDTVLKEIDDNFPFIVMKLDRCEADDVIGTLVKYANDYSDKQSGDGLFDEPESSVIVSTDGDFVQLQRYRNVVQYSNTRDEFIKPKASPTIDLALKCIIGDKGDNITNCRSHEDSLNAGIRQKSIMQAEKDAWSLRPQLIPEALREKYEFNRSLIDLSMIPKEYGDIIVQKYQEELLKGKNSEKVYSYFKDNGLVSMLKYIHDFI